jgi:hypothetical protein
MFQSAGPRPDAEGHPAVRGGAHRREAGRDPGRVRQDSGEGVAAAPAAALTMQWGHLPPRSRPCCARRR